MPEIQITPHIDKTPTNIGFVSTLNCISGDSVTTLPEIKQDRGTIYINGTCPCGDANDIRYDLEGVRKILTPSEISRRWQSGDQNLLTHSELLPIKEKIVGLDQPYTPLIRSRSVEDYIKKMYGVDIEVYLKLDALQPSGSFKDRPVGIAINTILETNKRIVDTDEELITYEYLKNALYDRAVTASTGSLIKRVMQLMKRYNIDGLGLVPHTLGDAKMTPLRGYANRPETFIEADGIKVSNKQAVVEELTDKLFSGGRHLIVVQGNYDQANGLGREVLNNFNKLCKEEHGYHRGFNTNNSLRTFYREGSKTSGHETAVQLKEIFGITDGTSHFFTAGGSGLYTCQVNKGLNEFRELGYTDMRDVVNIVQGVGCGPIVRTLLNNSDRIVPEKPKTIAESVAIGDPGSGYQAITLINKTGGTGFLIPEADILKYTLLLYELTKGEVPGFEEGFAADYVGGLVFGGGIEAVKHNKLNGAKRIILNITGAGKNIFDTLESNLDKLGFSGSNRKMLEKNIPGFIATSQHHLELENSIK